MSTHSHTDELVPDDESPAEENPAGVTLDDGDETALSISLGAKLIARFVRMHPAPFVL